MNWYEKPKFAITAAMLDKTADICEAIGALVTYLECNQDLSFNQDGISQCQLSDEDQLHQKILLLDMNNSEDFLELFKLLNSKDKLDASVFNGPLGRYKDMLELSLMYKNLKRFFRLMKNFEYHPVICCSYFSWFIIKNQPFENRQANDVIALFWQNIILSAWKPIFIRIPLIISIRRIKDVYNKNLARFTRNSDPTEFIEFNLDTLLSLIREQIKHLKQAKENTADQTENVEINNQIQASNSLQNIDTVVTTSDICAIDHQQLIQQTKSNILVSKEVEFLLSYLEQGKEYSKNELMKLIEIDDVRTFTNDFLKPALKVKLVQMTLPEKPTSKNQKYFKP